MFSGHPTSVPKIVPALARFNATGRVTEARKWGVLQAEGTLRYAIQGTHNPKVEGSNPSPATNSLNWLRFLPALFPHQLLTDY